MKIKRNIVLFTLPILLSVLNFAYAQSAYELAMQELQNKGAVSCNPDEAYNLILSRDAGGRSSGLSLKVKPKLDPKTQMFIDGIDPELACRIAALMKADPKIRIIHGYRSVADQRRLCGASGKPHGCAAPGRSCHNLGLAADLSFPGNYSRAYRQNLLSKFKLHLAYSSNGHVQCVEHRKANVDSCNTPCAKAGIAISQNGSGPQSSGPVQSDSTNSQDMFANNTQNQEQQSVAPVYGQYQNPYPNTSAYQYANEEAWEGVDSSELNEYDNWWSEYMNDGDEWNDNNDNTYINESVFTDNPVTNTADQYKPTLGFIGLSDSKVDAEEKTTANINQNMPSISSQASIVDSSPQEAEFAKSLSSKESIVDYFILSNSNTSVTSIGQVYNKKNNSITQNIFSWFINDDERRLKQGVNQDIYNPSLSNNKNINSDFANQVSQIRIKDTEQNDIRGGGTTNFRNIFSKTLDLSLFFSFPVLPIFTF